MFLKENVKFNSIRNNLELVVAGADLRGDKVNCCPERQSFAVGKF